AGSRLLRWAAVVEKTRASLAYSYPSEKGQFFGSRLTSLRVRPLTDAFKQANRRRCGGVERFEVPGHRNGHFEAGRLTQGGGESRAFVAYRQRQRTCQIGGVRSEERRVGKG